ncbi:MAG: DUF1858 domain-containing protein [Candidatus Margulisiibacteriota bacterium]
MMISKDMTILEMINTYPSAVAVLQKHGIGCLGCLMAHSESIGEGLSAHGVDVDAVLAEIEAMTIQEKVS